MALEPGDHIGERPVDIRWHAIAVAAQVFAEVGFVRLRRYAGRCVGRPDPDSRRCQAWPGKQLARILLAVGRHVGMSHHARPCYRRMTLKNPARKRDHSSDLVIRERNIAEFVAGIDDLDADGTRIHVAHAGPPGYAGMPRPPLL